MGRDSHVFALYCSKVNSAVKATSIVDKDLVHRITKVLRLKNGEQLILFNKQVHIVVELVQVRSTSIAVVVLVNNKNRVLSPVLTLVLPLLKRDGLEQAIYNATEMGASSIQLIITEKSRQKLHAKEHARLERIVVAAAEQSKQFVLPELFSPVKFDKLLLKRLYGSSRLFADPEGTPLFDLLSLLKKEDLLLMVGPEGDLTPREKDLLVQEGFSFCLLTPTILRSFQAASLLVGICRTYFS